MPIHVGPRDIAPGSFTRRSLVLGSAGLAAASIAGCSTDGGYVTPTDRASASAAISAAVPAHKPYNPVAPALNSFNGALKIYDKWPSELPTSVPEAPGSGSKLSFMVQAVGGLPTPQPQNAYFNAMNKALNVDFTIHPFLPSDGLTKISTLLASPKDLDDWTVIASSQEPPGFADAMDSCFEDLTPYLAGSAAEQYPNLANITTETWQQCVINGKLMCLPYPNTPVGEGGLFYRKDLLDKLGITDAPKTADDLATLCESISRPKDGRWAIDHPWSIAPYLYGVVPKWKLDGDKLVHRYETNEYKAALEFAVRLFSAGVVHPDAISKQADAEARFAAGSVQMYGASFWRWIYTITGLGRAVPGFEMEAFPMFAADGGTPVYYWNTPLAGIRSFIKKGTSKDHIEEIIRCANYLAAPFGTKEFLMVRYGAEGTGHTWNADGFAVQTDQFYDEFKGVFLYNCGPNRPECQADRQYMKSLTAYMKNAESYIQKPLFFAQNIYAPPNLGGLDQQMTDFQNDLFAGRKKMGDFDAAVDAWRSAGGDELREFYSQYLDS